MIVKKHHFLALALLAVALSACQKDPSTDNLRKDFLVYTGYAEQTDFASFDTYFIPDSILLIGSSKSEYWKGTDAEQVVGAFVEGLNAAGYTRVEEREGANLGIQLSYVKEVTYFVGYDRPYWWWDYPYYWAPGYWGDHWYGWHYPYQVYYGYTAGSLLGEMMDLAAPTTANAKLPVVWDTFISGLLTSSSEINLERTLQGIAQAFEQSPYLKK